MNRTRQWRGLTLVEVMVVLAIAAVLVAVLVPVLTGAKRGAQIQSSIQKMRQLAAALEIYRGEWGSEGVYDYYALGIPPRSYEWPFDQSFWYSPCGVDRTIFLSAAPPYALPGQIAYVAPLYAPTVLKPGSSNKDLYEHYLERYRQNAVMFVDYYCNDAGTSMIDVAKPKRGIALLLSGQVLNRIRIGNAQELQFFSDPPADGVR